MTQLWCYIEGKRDISGISISPDLTIHDLKKQIYAEEHIQFIVQCSPTDLTLTKVNEDLDVVGDKIRAGQYQLDANDQQRLRANDKIFNVWPEPPADHLHVVVTLPVQPRPQSASPSARSKKHSTPHHGPHDSVPKHKKEFEDFHTSNGVRTITGSIGPVQNVRMLLKTGYRYVYISRKFAMRHGFIPQDAAPGHYGYSGLVNTGKLPITVGKTKTTHAVYLSEESHFDVVLGRSFMEKRQIKTNPIDPTDIVCLDTGEKLDCELVILKDGKGEIVTVT